MPLSPRLVDFLEGVNKLTARLKARGAAPTPGDSRMRMDALARYMSARPEIAHVEDGVIHHDGIETPVRIYSPEPEEALPVLVYYHGGGCMCGSVELYDPIVRKIARAARVIVASVEYRLAPENPYPAGLNDARAAAGNIWRLLGDVKHQKRLFIGGDSAGGGLAASIVMENPDAGDLEIEKQVLIYPGLDYTLSANSHGENGRGFFMEAEHIEFFLENYFQNGEDRRDASPLFGKFSNHMPETLVLTAEFDPLRDEGFLYCEKLKAHGVRAERHCFPGMVHAFLNLEDLVQEEAAELYGRIADFLQSA